MYTGRYNHLPKLIGYLRLLDCFKDDPFFVIDVGCSGGIPDKVVELWGENLRAIGFDPIVDEIDRLRAANKHPGIDYVAAFVGCDDSRLQAYDDPNRPAEKNPDYSTYIPNRTSADLATSLLKVDFSETYFNEGKKIVYADLTVSLDDYLRAEDKSRINLIKTDTDGLDHLVLLGAEEILHSPNLLGVIVEVNFHRKVWKASNCFAFVDNYLHKFGFSVYDMHIQRYARPALPMPFCYDLPCQTVSGQVNWCDAIYFRDFGRTDYEQHWFSPPSINTILKLACLLEIFDLQDCAVELLLKYRVQIEMITPLRPVLNMLTPHGRSYEQHMATFEEFAKAKNWKGFQ